ncbi:hypothetical protein FJ208_01615, partial [Candidatus Gribaldobacteria bacterium]|nr:hypothetical protein [Candidatus Gribaldobacteria bacterium]
MLEFASAVINIWEKKIFSQQDQERMLKAPDEKAAFAVLFDTDLAGFAVKEKNFEILANKDIEETRRKLAAVLKEEPLLLTLLFLKFDCLHLKIILKRFFGLADFETEPIIFQASNLPF